MRNLFLALLLANLGFAAWYHWFAERPQPGRAAAVESLPGITLVSEVDPALLRAQPAQPGLPPASSDDFRQFPGPGGQFVDSDDLPAEIAVTGIESQSRPPLTGEQLAQLSAVGDGDAAAFAALRCISVGPYRDLGQAAAAASGLRMAGHATSQRVAEEDVWVGYWVYLDRIPTLAEANEILERVRAGDVTDSYVISGGETGHLVSVGVFSEIGRATLRREEIQALGLNPVIADRTQRTTVYWVDVNVAGDEVLDIDTLQVSGRIMRLEQRPCPAQ